MSSKRLLLYASDAYKLSSLILRRVLLAKPATLNAFREKTRQLLLDQSRPSSPTSSSSPSANIAAIKLLELDREWNLVQYHGVPDYAKRWWESKSWSFSISNRNESISTQKSKQPETNETQTGESNMSNVARVAFMITSEQRHKLSSKLGYTSQDIRSFKPIEAMLLLEHDVKRESDDFRVKLKELVEENERLTIMQHQEHSQNQDNQADTESLIDHNPITKGDRRKGSLEQSSFVSPKEAQQIHAKPDVAMALLSADISAKNEDGRIMSKEEEVEVEGSLHSSSRPNAAENTTIIASTENSDNNKLPAALDPPLSASTFQPSHGNVTPGESEDLRMKPDVAAAILDSQHQKEPHGQQRFVDDKYYDEEVDDDGPYWYEVVERLSALPNATVDDGNQNSSSNPRRDQVIALFPTKTEALECVRIKKSIRGREQIANTDIEGIGDERYLVRRRWNV